MRAPGLRSSTFLEPQERANLGRDAIEVGRPRQAGWERVVGQLAFTAAPRDAEPARVALRRVGAEKGVLAVVAWRKAQKPGSS